jgi:toxin ParE1/3/4
VTLAIRIEAEASADLVSVVEHYRREAGSDIALRFVDQAEAAFRFLARHPEAGRMFEGATHLRLRSLRAWRMRGFPYLIFYEADARAVRIYSIVHASRDISQLLGRRFREGD